MSFEFVVEDSKAQSATIRLIDIRVFSPGGLSDFLRRLSASKRVVFDWAWKVIRLLPGLGPAMRDNYAVKFVEIVQKLISHTIERARLSSKESEDVKGIEGAGRERVLEPLLPSYGAALAVSANYSSDMLVHCLEGKELTITTFVEVIDKAVEVD
ncbi:hypothetical protein R3P38DRAFT_2808359 [Favolaschia claudopus]|uniref:Uncharacterized protein n=1 Tax=Favolaschia claudopus TaxID=2862362 RepID=A0AAV9ZGV4_9AGAR